MVMMTLELQGQSSAHQTLRFMQRICMFCMYLLTIKFEDDLLTVFVAGWNSWYAVFEVIFLGPLLEYAWVCGVGFCFWVGLWLYFCWAGRRTYYHR